MKIDAVIAKSEPVIPPWANRSAWRAANEAMSAAMDRLGSNLSDLAQLARRICVRIEALDALMSQLCRATCTSCRDNCCQRATVWYDFKDLLYCHLAAVPVPQAQTIGSAGLTCRHLGQRGCTVPRTRRPFVCTWFLCDAQKRILAHWPASRRIFLHNSLVALKHGRKELEVKFIQIVKA